MSGPTPFLFVSVHKGPYLSIESLEHELGPDGVQYLVEGVSKKERMRQGLPYLDLGRVRHDWGTLESFLEQTGTKAIIRSSSEDVPEPNVEDLASRAARKADVPVFVVEDFLGNYRFRSDQRLDGLFVEDESAAALHVARGVESRLVHIAGNPRYSLLRQLDRRKRRTWVRNALGLDNHRAMLWAGQPDGSNSYQALERVLDHFDHPHVTLLFRAHPRDDGYQSGKYLRLLARRTMGIIDVTEYPDILDLYCAVDLVVTQFSSAGVEASYLGAPAVFVMFEDLGKEYLRILKGYDALPWCRAGGAFLIEHQSDVADVMSCALFDEKARGQRIARFQEQFSLNGTGGRTIANLVRETLNCSTRSSDVNS